MVSLWQNAPSISLESGCYDGLTSISQLREHGDLGVGAFEHLDGEMTGVDGTFYRVFEDGSARPAEDSELVAFAMVIPFGPVEPRAVPKGLTDADLPAYMDRLVGTKNYFFALRLEGAFANMTTRCFPRQEKPYASLAEVMKTQPTFSHPKMEGTLVGFRAPSYVGNMTPGGYHLHLISADRSIGGHVITFEIVEATVAVERVAHHEIEYPNGDNEFAAKELE